MPFIMQQQLHMPSQTMRQRFCSMPQATSSSQEHVIFIPPVHFSIFMMHRGSIMLLGEGIDGCEPAMGIPIGMPIPIIDGPMIARSIIIILPIL